MAITLAAAFVHELLEGSIETTQVEDGRWLAQVEYTTTAPRLVGTGDILVSRRAYGDTAHAAATALVNTLLKEGLIG